MHMCITHLSLANTKHFIRHPDILSLSATSLLLKSRQLLLFIPFFYTSTGKKGKRKRSVGKVWRQCLRNAVTFYCHWWAQHCTPSLTVALLPFLQLVFFSALGTSVCLSMAIGFKSAQIIWCFLEILWFVSYQYCAGGKCKAHCYHQRLAEGLFGLRLCRKISLRITVGWTAIL